MKIQYASDLHLEFVDNVDYLKANPLEVAGDILVLAGDTIYLGDRMEDAGWFFDWCSRNFKQTYLLPGNHEYYGGYPLEETLNEFKLEVRDNVTYLNNRSVVIEDTELFFTTMWTFIPHKDEDWITRVMNDFRHIRYNGEPFDIRGWNETRSICWEWLSGALSDSKARNKIVVTHHCPYSNNALVMYAGWANRAAYFVSMWPKVSKFNIDFWIHGHVHLPWSHNIYGCKIASNTLGYVTDNENKDFSHEAVLDTVLTPDQRLIDAVHRLDPSGIAEAAREGANPDTLMGDSVPPLVYLIDNSSDTGLCSDEIDMYAEDRIYEADDLIKSRRPRLWECIVALLDAGADPNYCPEDAFDCDPLTVCALKGDPEIMQLLIDRGADTNFNCNPEYYPEISSSALYALENEKNDWRQSQRQEMIRLLKRYGAVAKIAEE